MQQYQKIVIGFIIVLIIALALVVVFSHGPGSTSHQSDPIYSVYTFTRNGNHTQYQVNYSVGSSSGLSQLEWLSFDNKTALGNYVQETDEDCVATIINNNSVEFQTRVDCDTMGIYVLTPSGNHTQYQTSYIGGATSGPVQIEWLNFNNKTALRDYVAVTFSGECVSSIVENTSSEFQIQISNKDSGLTPC